MICTIGNISIDMIVTQPKPTGFEEYFAEAPITPEEHYHELNIYSK